MTDPQSPVKKESADSDKPKEQSPSEQDAPSWVLWSAASYAIIMLVLGLPLWWKTTAVERVFLPYDQMMTSKEYLSENLKIAVNVELSGFSQPSNEDDFLQRLGDTLQGFQFNFTYSQPSSRNMDAIYKSENINEIDSKMCQRGSDPDTFTLHYVGRADFFKLHNHKIIIGNCRSAYYISNSSKMLSAITSEFFEKLLPSSAKKSKEGSPEEKEKLQLPLSLGYDILVSLVVPEPEFQDYTFKIEDARKAYMNSLAKKLSNFAEMNVRSQYLYYVKLNVDPKFNKVSKTYEIPYAQLPLVINPVESKLTSFVSQNIALNFLVYFSPCGESPLIILDPTGQPTPSNAFLVPQWGGIQIYNDGCSAPEDIPNSTQTESQNLHEVNVKGVISVVSSQLRALMGVPAHKNEKSVNVLKMERSALRDWEIDVIIRKRLHTLLFTTANTLQSLGQLLDQITNIVVSEEVGLEVQKSTEAMYASVKYASEGKLVEAQAYAMTAYKASEIAFHHPSNLAQLYFPDDQKYAIYIPLFLPIGIPVLMSLQSIFRKLSSSLKAKSKSKVE